MSVALEVAFALHLLYRIIATNLARYTPVHTIDSGVVLSKSPTLAHNARTALAALYLISHLGN